jgi:ABC-type nitrate/sulfonate/bicarbonate transport system substrate-binding protein
VSGYFATGDWLAKHRDTALAFGRAYLRAAKELTGDTALRTQLMEKLLGMKPQIAKMIPNVVWFHDLSVKKDAIAPNYDALVKTGMLTKKFNIDDAFVTLPF